MRDDVSPRLIDLALEPAFTLAGLEVRPASLEVLAGARREQLEHRIMQVLVALAGHRGEVVSRDELIQRCWGGRVVGDDSINRCIFQLRKLAESLGGFEIVTVPRVGFRLSEGAMNRPAARGRRWLGRAAAVAMGLALALGVVGWWAWQERVVASADHEPQIEVLPFVALDGDRAAQTLSAKLTDTLVGVLSENALGPKSAGASSAPADLILGGTVARAGQRWRVRAYVEDGPTKFPLWSGEFTGPIAGEAALSNQVAVRLLDTAESALHPFEQPGFKIDARTLALYVNASVRFKNPKMLGATEPTQAFEEVVARAPRFAAARAVLALNLANLSNDAPAAERGPLRQRARREAERALREGPFMAGRTADPFYMLARAEHPDDLAAAEDELLTAIRAGSRFPYLHMRACRFLMEVGRAAEAVRNCERAVGLRPYSAPIGWTYAAALNAEGSQGRAESAIRTVLGFYPDHFQARRVNFELAAFEGSADEALTILRDPARTQLVAGHSQAAALELFLKARKSGAPTDIEAAIQALRAAGVDRFNQRTLVLAAAILGRIDDAFDALEEPGLKVTGDPGILLDPAAASLRRDPRFWRAAAKAGYLAYWRKRGVWPDFCSDPAVGIDCKAQAARAEGRG